MNIEFFQCSIRYDKVMETGLLKKVTETYLVEALSYTEAEKRIMDEMSSYISGEWEVSDIRRLRLAEVVESSDATADCWYKAKIAFITLDEKTGAERQTSQALLVQAPSFVEAVKALYSCMKGTLGDWIIISLGETKILDIFRYTESS